MSKYSPEPKKYQHEYDPNSAKDFLALELERKLADSIYQRTTIDERILDDLRQFHGRYSHQEERDLEQAGRSRVFVNMTRPKTNAAEAQMVDLLFPNDDRNWGIQPTPVPEMVEQLADDSPAVVGGTEYQDENGNIIKNSDLVRREMEIARTACNLMEEEIEDQLVESSFNSKCRQVIHDGVTVGTGILKGPVVTGKLDRVYKRVQDPETGTETFMLLMEESFVPATEVVRPWDFFPDMSGANIGECEFVFERRYMTRKQVRELVKRKGYPETQVRKVLDMSATETQHGTGAVDDIRRLAGLNDTLNDSRYEVWEYHGPVSLAVFKEFEVPGFEEIDEEDALTERDGVVIYCGGIVLSVRAHVIDHDATFPYRVWNWEEDESCIFGKGVPRLMNHEQRIMNTAWRALLDNASVTAGPQIGLRRKHVNPVDGNWEIKAFKLWEIREGGSMGEAMQKMEFNNHQGELSNIYQMGRQMADEVTGLPMLQQGEQGPSTPVLGGMSMLMNAANTVRRNQVKMWDDRVTTPLIRDFYHFNMRYSQRDDIKGDYQVHARGTSALLVRETLSNAILNLLNLAGANPMVGNVVAPKIREIMVQWAKTQQLPKDLIPTVEEIMQYEENVRAAQEGQGQALSPAEINAQAQLQVEQMRSELKQQQMQLEAQNSERELAMKAQMQQYEGQLKMQLAQLELQSQMSKQERSSYTKCSRPVRLKSVNSLYD